MDLALIITQLGELRIRLKRRGENVIQNHPNWKSKTDARVAVFNRNDLILNNLYMALGLQEKCLQSVGWWTANFTFLRPITAADIQVEISEFERFIKVGFIQSHFSAVETAFRTSIRAIDPGSCKNGTAEFESIYKHLLGEIQVPRPQREQYVDLLNFWREIRNIIHNNGVYFHASGQDKTGVYKGVGYILEHGKGVNFITWPFLFFIVEDVHQMVIDVVESHAISSVAVIDDPFTLSFPNPPIIQLRA